MKIQSALLCFVLLPASSLFAQGPRGGGFGPMGGPERGPGPMGRGPGAMGGAPSVVTGAPYSAVEVVQSQETLADGNVIQRKRQTNVFRDSEGRIRTEQTITPDASTGKQPYTLITILDYVGGHRYELNSSTMTATQSPLRVPHTPPAGTPSTAGVTPGGRRGGNGGATAGTTTEQLRPNVVRTALAPQSVNGVLATGTQHTETIPVGAIGNARAIQTSRTTWISNDLKVPVQIRSTDPRFGSTDMELTNIVPAEPSASLFVVPAGYTVKTEGFGGGPRGGGPGGPGGPRGQNRGPRPGPPPQQ
jgi:hypothetical protein